MERPVVVVPLTFGRAPALVSDTARVLRDLRSQCGPVALAPALGDATMLVTHLRAAIRRAPEADACLVASPSIDPFADADLFHHARLARQYGHPELVEVAFDGGADPDPDLAAGIRRCRALGARTVTLVSATLASVAVPPDAATVTNAHTRADGEFSPTPGLLSAAALRSIVETRVAEAVHRLAHGDDGVDTGAEAEDGHGYAHSHVAADGTVYTHSH